MSPDKTAEEMLAEARAAEDPAFLRQVAERIVLYGPVIDGLRKLGHPQWRPVLDAAADHLESERRLLVLLYGDPDATAPQGILTMKNVRPLPWSEPSPDGTDS